MAKKKAPWGPSLAALKEEYKKATGKSALYCGKLSKGFQEWRKQKQG